MYYCKDCGQLDAEGISGHVNRCATNNATNGDKHDRGSATNNPQEGICKQTQSPVKAVAKVERSRKKSIQRSNGDDGSKPGNVPASETGKPETGVLEDDRLECGVDGSRSGKTLNRRSREAYNAYQREYMRKRRSDAKAKTIEV